MDIIIKDYDEMSRYAAEIIAGFIKSNRIVCLDWQQEARQSALTKNWLECTSTGTRFSQVKTFNLDEYLGIGMDLVTLSWDQATPGFARGTF